jgi:hypothetical protein
MTLFLEKSAEGCVEILTKKKKKKNEKSPPYNKAFTFSFYCVLQPESGIPGAFRGKG